MKNIIITIAITLMVFSLDAQVNYQNNNVSGNNASALGTNNVSSGETSFVSGHNSTASGGYSTALGNTAVASGLHSVALGSFSTAQADGSVAIGPYAKTHLGADFSFAMGNLVEANASGSIVLGIAPNYNYPLVNSIPNSLMIGFQSDTPTLFVGSANGQGTVGKVGIGTTAPNTLLDVSGTLNVDNTATFGENLSVNNQMSTKKLKITYGAAANKILQSDANGLASWVDPMTLAVDDGDWTINGNDVYRLIGNVGIGTSTPVTKLDVAGTIHATSFSGDGSGLTNVNNDWTIGGNNVYRLTGNVGIGTNSPQCRFQIDDNLGNLDGEFFKVSNENVPGGGTTLIGKDAGNGPVFVQQAGSMNFGSSGPHLSIKQKAFNGTVGLDISTFTNQNGDISWSNIEAPNSSFYLIASKDLIFRTGASQNQVYFTADGNVGIGIAVPQAKLHVMGDIKAVNMNLSGSITAQQMNFSNFEVGFLTVTEKIEAAEIEVKEISKWKDEVFEDNYPLPSLTEVGQYIEDNKHLPEMPSESEILDNGYSVSEMDALLLQKIEELTLYVIELEKKIKNIEKH